MSNQMSSETAEWCAAQPWLHPLDFYLHSGIALFLGKVGHSINTCLVGSTFIFFVVHNCVVNNLAATYVLIHFRSCSVKSAHLWPSTVEKHSFWIIMKRLSVIVYSQYARFNPYSINSDLVIWTFTCFSDKRTLQERIC